MRSELAQLCLRAADVHVVGEAESGGEAIDAAESLSPDVMLIDVALPDMSRIRRRKAADSERLAS